VEPENGSALLGAAAAAEELCVCIISLLLAPSTALHCSVAAGCSGAPGRASSGRLMTIYAGARLGTARRTPPRRA